MFFFWSFEVLKRAPCLRSASRHNGVHKERQHWSRKRVYMFKLWKAKSTSKGFQIKSKKVKNVDYLWKHSVSDFTSWQKKKKRRSFDQIVSDLLFVLSVCWLQVPLWRHVTVVWCQMSGFKINDSQWPHCDRVHVRRGDPFTYFWSCCPSFSFFFFSE